MCARAQSGILTANDIAINYLLGPVATAAAMIPTGLTAIPGDSQAVLSWNVSSNAVGYNVKRSANQAGPYSVIAPGLTTLGFTNTGLSNGIIYYYVVSATNSAGESANSAPVSVQPVSAVAPQLSFSLNSGQLQFNWPQDHTGWSLQVQTNSLNAGIGINWVNVPTSNTTNQMTFPVDPTSGSVFYRLVYPSGF